MLRGFSAPPTTNSHFPIRGSKQGIMTAKPEGIEETTRICIKNVPPSYTDSKLKAHLASSSEPLTITDCKILRTKDGVSRKLAFVGFKNHIVSLCTRLQYMNRDIELLTFLRFIRISRWPNMP